MPEFEDIQALEPGMDEMDRTAGGASRRAPPEGQGRLHPLQGQGRRPPQPHRGPASLHRQRPYAPEPQYHQQEPHLRPRMPLHPRVKKRQRKGLRPMNGGLFAAAGCISSTRPTQYEWSGRTAGNCNPKRGLSAQSADRACFMYSCNAVYSRRQVPRCSSLTSA